MVFDLFEDFKVIIDFLIEDFVVLECMYSKCKSGAKSWFMRNGAYINLKFNHIKKVQKEKKHQKQGCESRISEEEEAKIYDHKSKREFLCVALFEAPNYSKEKKLPKLLKKCMPYADAIFSSLKDLKEYLRKQICLQKLVNRAIIAEQQPPLHREKSGMMKLENFLPKNTEKNSYKSRNRTIKENIGGQVFEEN